MYINLTLLLSPDKAQKYKIRSPGNYPEESIQHSEHAEVRNQEDTIFFNLAAVKLFNCSGTHSHDSPGVAGGLFESKARSFSIC